ncbi:MAG TPA: shikimate dehydrogenase [Allosphingosinicella sp.]|jgi:shikimate dehydrogenase
MGVPYAEVIGDPVAHSKSPLIHKFWLAKLGLDYDYVSTRVTPAELPGFVDMRRRDPLWCGCSVTIPHKQSVIGALDEMDPAASEIGAVNCITREGRAAARLIGRNTDWEGFVEPLRPWLERNYAFRSADVIGAGGAASAVCYALDRADVNVYIYGRTREKAKRLALRLQPENDPPGADLAMLSRPAERVPAPDPERLGLLVNATPLGMAGFEPLPINLDLFPPTTLVYDLVYVPAETPLLRAARERGMPRIDGFAMLVGQAAVAFERFYAEPAPREYDSELRDLLVR